MESMCSFCESRLHMALSPRTDSKNDHGRRSMLQDDASIWTMMEKHDAGGSLTICIVYSTVAYSIVFFLRKHRKKQKFLLDLSTESRTTSTIFEWSMYSREYVMSDQFSDVGEKG